MGLYPSFYPHMLARKIPYEHNNIGIARLGED